MAQVDRSRRLVYALCDRLQLTFWESGANFVLVRTGNGSRVYEALLRRGVIVRPMDGYGFAEHLRVSIGLPQENERCIAALEAVLGTGPR